MKILKSKSIQDQNGEKEFNLVKKFTTEDLWGAQLTLKAACKKNQQLIRDIESVKLVLTSHKKPADKRGEPVTKHFAFVEGKLVF